jgi:anthranilate phosphoribosyltransferase
VDKSLVHGLFVWQKRPWGDQRSSRLFCFLETLGSPERRRIMIKEAIGKVVMRKDLTGSEMEAVMKEIAKRDASSEQIASFVTALRMKGETPEEITAAGRVIKEKASSINVEGDVVSLDREEITVERETILRTAQGKGLGTNVFNISTAVALVVAGGGLRVAKYGRKSDTTLCGSADVVETLGIGLDMTSTQLEKCVEEVGICFLYEPLVQKNLEHLIAIRKKIGVRTIFNLLDPLLNSAGARTQVLGVYEPDLTEKMASVLKSLGIRRGLTIHGQNTLDEISTTGWTKITEFNGEEIKNYLIKPEDFGVKRVTLADISGGTRKQNAEIILEILQGHRGPRRDITVLNAAAVFMAAGKARDFKEGTVLANQSIDSGQAFNTLQRLIEFTNRDQGFLRKTYEEHMERRV